MIKFKNGLESILVLLGCVLDISLTPLEMIGIPLLGVVDNHVVCKDSGREGSPL